jgi:hypothetical protein
MKNAESKKGRNRQKENQENIENGQGLLRGKKPLDQNSDGSC